MCHHLPLEMLALSEMESEFEEREAADEEEPLAPAAD